METSFQLSALACVALALAGCGRDSPLAADERIAARQLNNLIPRGTSEARAMKALSNRGFQLSRPSLDHASNHLVIGSYSEGDFYWQVGVVIVDAKVTATTVKVTNTRALPK